MVCPGGFGVGREHRGSGTGRRSPEGPGESRRESRSPAQAVGLWGSPGSPAGPQRLPRGELHPPGQPSPSSPCQPRRLRQRCPSARGDNSQGGDGLSSIPRAQPRFGRAAAEPSRSLRAGTALQGSAALPRQLRLRAGLQRLRADTGTLEGTEPVREALNAASERGCLSRDPPDHVEKKEKVFPEAGMRWVPRGWSGDSRVSPQPLLLSPGEAAF